MPGLISDIDNIDTKPKFTNEPILKKSFTEQIHRVCFSPYDWSQDLLCIVLEDKIQILEVKIQVI